MTKYKLEIKYDSRTNEITSKNVYGNWPEHHNELRKLAEEQMIKRFKEGKLENTLITTIEIGSD